MNLALIIYAINVADSVTQLCGFMFGTAIIVGGIALVASAIWSTGEDEGTFTKLITPFVKPVCIILIASAIIGIVTPNKHTAYAMLAAYGGQSIIESDTVQRLAPKSLAILESYMDKQLNELKTENDDEIQTF